jgi:DNA-binding IclR family transcriptional regulator
LLTGKCVKVLNAFENGHWMTAREIGKKINLPTVSVGRICLTLIRLGLVEKKPVKLNYPPGYFLSKRRVYMYRRRRF